MRLVFALSSAQATRSRWTLSHPASDCSISRVIENVYKDAVERHGVTANHSCIAVLLVCVATLCGSCDRAHHSWRQDFLAPEQLRATNIRTTVPDAIVGVARRNYESDPYRPGYTKLELNKAFHMGKRYTLVFRIPGIDDVGAVYVLDEGGNVLDRFAQSDWN